MISPIATVALACVATTALAASVASNNDPKAVAACSQISRQSYSAGVAYVGSAQYNYDISHWSNASSLPATCTVEPSSPQQIQQIISIINSTRSPWAVKGIGHCNNQNMSSTVGVQIDMAKFRNVIISNDKSKVTLGMGLTWTEVYEALDGKGINVVGGRLGIVGVAGLSLSSGYAWITNKYGFAIDNVLSYDIVLPNGTFTTVTSTTSPDLFFALQGGLNNFGIVTQITVRAFPVGQVWGGTVVYAGNLSQVSAAAVEYAAKKSDPNATLAVENGATNGSTTATIIMYYDAPTPPAGLFDKFLALPNATVNVKTRSFLDLINTSKLVVTPNNRATWYSAPILQYTREIVDYITEQMTMFSVRLAKETKSGMYVSGNVEPFGVEAYSHGRDSAWPHSTAMPFNTFNGLFIWTDPSEDKQILDMVLEYHGNIWAKAIQLGVSRKDAYFPPNYSQSITPVSQIYGPNLPRLRKIKNAVDPWGIIALTGGFKI